MQFESLSDLEEDLDRLLKIGEEGVTAYRVAPIFDKYSDSDDDSKPFSGCHRGLTITSTPHGRFVYWKGMEPSKLLKYNSRLVAFTQELPFQEGKPHSPIAEEGEGRTILVEYNSSDEFSPQHHVYMDSLHEHGNDDEPGREYNDELFADLNGASVAADDRKYNTPIGNITEAALLIQRLPQNYAMRYYPTGPAEPYAVAVAQPLKI
jgi:hypothetical protein